MNKRSLSQSGFTLLELLVAAAMLAVILVAAERAISVAQRSAEISQARAQSVRDLDRFWVLVERDLRNVTLAAMPPHLLSNGSAPLASLQISTTETFLLSLLRIGQSNPLALPRSEAVRVAYRLDDGVLWRDSWIDPWRPEQEQARAQQLLTNVEELDVVALPLPPAARSVDGGPWVDEWPQQLGANVLPMAVELRLNLKQRDTITRFIRLVNP